jgi:hypothetical protein
MFKFSVNKKARYIVCTILKRLRIYRSNLPGHKLRNTRGLHTHEVANYPSPDIRQRYVGFTSL